MDELFECNCKLCGTYITAQSQEAAGAKGVISVGKMLDHRRFWYGLFGVCHFTFDLGLKKGDSICYTCLKKYAKSIEPDKTVKCALCGEMYQLVSEYNDTGFDCASKVNRKENKLELRAGYGSKYDCMRYDITLPILIEGDLVCDKCIEGLIDEETLSKET